MKKIYTLAPLLEDRRSDPSDGVLTFTMGPQLPWKTLGLVALGTSLESELRNFQIGNQVFQPCFGSLPLALFEPAKTKNFKELVRLAEAGELPSELRDFQKFEAGICLVGSQIMASISGPCSHLAVYGYSIGGSVVESVKISLRKESREGREVYLGTVVISGFEGDREDLAVEAPTEESCLAVLSARAGVLQKRSW